MPKNKSLKLRWVDSIQEKCFLIAGETIRCNVCEKEITCERKSLLEQHLKTKFHLNNKRQQEINTIRNEEDSIKIEITDWENEFNIDLCRAMTAVNMPWQAVNNNVFRNFLGKYTSMPIPEESTLRKNYLESCYEESINAIKQEIGENYIWISVDETTDSLGRYIANCTVGRLSVDAPGVPHLLASKKLDVTNYSTIARFVNDSLRILWPNGNDEKVLLFLTDDAPYMTKAGDHLKIFYPNMIHLTCLAHWLNRVIEQVRLNSETVNNLISCVKKVFLKCPYRVAKYKEYLGDVQLPPEPVINRWDTWLDAALFHADHFEEIKYVINSFDPQEAISVKSAQNVYQDPEIQTKLIFLKTHFSYLPKVMTKLEKKYSTLNDAINIVENTFTKLKEVPGVFGENIIEKLDLVLKQNPGYAQMVQINSYVSGSTIENTDVKFNINNLCCYYKYAPITCCDVERSFSAYKLILTDKLHQFNVENLEKVLVTYCGSNYN